MRQVNTDIFDGKCKAYIEGYRFIPTGEKWIRSDGVIFSGLMVSPAENYSILLRLQEQYEADKAVTSDMEEALEILGVTE